MATALSEASLPPSAAVPDLLGSEADFDQLPSTPALGENADGSEGASDEELEGDNDDDGSADEHEADDGGDEEEGAEDEGDDDYEVIEDPAQPGQREGNASAGEAADGDQLADDHDATARTSYTEPGADAEGGDDGDGEGELPTVLIEFEDSLFDLFAQQAGQGSGQDAIPLKAPSDILDQPLSSLFSTLRIPDALGEFLEQDTLLLLRSQEVDLELLENDASAEQVLLQDFLDIHATNANGEAVRLILAQRLPFLHRFKALGGVVNPVTTAKLSPTTALSSWMSPTKLRSRRNNAGDDEADELDDEFGDADGVLGEHHEPDAEDEGREGEWDGIEGDGEVHEHWSGEGADEGEGEDEDEEYGNDDDDVILIEDDEPNDDAGVQHEEGYDEGEHEVLEKGDGADEGDDDYDEDGDGATAAAHDPTTGDAQEQEYQQTDATEAAPALAAWKEPSSSADDTYANEDDADNKELSAQDAAPVSQAVSVEGVGSLGASSSLIGKRSFDESAEGEAGATEIEANKRSKP